MIALLRSILFVPAIRPDRFAKALASGADAVVFDLEDSVDPARKAEAREGLARSLEEIPGSGARRFVRVNAAGSPWIADDLAAVRSLRGIDAIVLPKAEAPDDVARVAGALASRRVVPLLESARGILHAGAIAQANASIPAILFGAEDLTAQLAIPRTIDGDELLFARSQVVLAAAAAGAEPIDAVFIDLDAADALRRDALRARALGFRGKMAIHPNQMAVINEVFSPSADEIADARGLVEAYEAASARGEGVIRYAGVMVDVPIVARARRILARAAAIEARNPP
jgi:citrate lyase subunit beta/citryl-CoA lyase